MVSACVYTRCITVDGKEKFHKNYFPLDEYGRDIDDDDGLCC